MSMFKITIICLGKFKEKAYLELENEYLKRIKAYARFNLVELSEEPYRKNQDINNVKLKEAEIIKKHIPKECVVILLQENGQSKDSPEFASFIDRLGSIGQEICFVIGSGIGLHDSLKEVANYYVSLSPLTFPHNLARIILLEQIYRSFTIIAGKEYHK